ncbi:cation diffusion facilitator family transporter [Marinobacter sp. CHS3-4]|uniref:cation diffusion facilitator family transporter n=1 Tax=Marinobacter sp. CHS3-4 TaxID=3045174 RepID=UPI0024B60CE9|nr:cation diffusion facilitator family transporter [Marinobacter sp. CHS3-4]MDI9246905.1 cation diffusion facilitator family transporter [Marinobacter sp. CHS3-4]
MSDPRTQAPSQRKALDTERHEATRITVIGMILDAVLGAIKVVGGLLFHSQALIVDGIHSFSDVASDVVVLAVMRLSRQAPDQEHPYGHQRIETLGTMVLGSFLIAVGAALAWDNFLRLLDTEGARLPQWPVLVAAAISVLSKEWIYRYTRRVGLAIRSDLIVANAWHSRTDALSSVVVLVSTAGAMMGHVWLDVLAAIVISILIVHIGWRFAWDSVKELVDTGLSPEDTETLREAAKSVEGVRNVHELRSRKMGQDILLDVHLVVRPEISVSEGHQIGMRVVAAMRASFDNILDINFHVDAENDDEQSPTSETLPNRSQIREALEEHFPVDLPPNSRFRLHYLKNRVHIELFLELDGQQQRPDSQAISQQMESYPWFGSLHIWFS